MLKYTENARNVREHRENGQLEGEKMPTEKMEFLDSDTDREIETDAEDSKITQKYTVSRNFRLEWSLLTSDSVGISLLG